MDTPKNSDNQKQRVTSLYAKGGIMLFTIERQNRLYKGTVMLFPVENCYQRRAMYIKEFRYSNREKSYETE